MYRDMLWVYYKNRNDVFCEHIIKIGMAYFMSTLLK